MYVEIRPKGEGQWLILKPEDIVHWIDDENTEIWELRQSEHTEESIKDLPEFPGW